MQRVELVYVEDFLETSRSTVFDCIQVFFLCFEIPNEKCPLVCPLAKSVVSLKEGEEAVHQAQLQRESCAAYVATLSLVLCNCSCLQNANEVACG
jgi:hypothetical protein